MSRRINKKYLCGFLILCVLSVFPFAGCGKEENQPVWPSDISIGMMDEDGIEEYDMQIQTMIYGTGSHTYVENLDGTRKDTWEKKLFVMNLTVGDGQEEIFENYSIASGYASISYETMNDSGQTVTSENEIYDGTGIDLTESDCYDCMIMIAYYYNNGKWHQLNFETDDLENYDHVIAITYDIQGPEGNYGVETGRICGLFCEYY